jgi:hypothetical protein
MIRNDFLLQGLDKSCCKGVEVGPWYSPVAPKREGWQSIVIDFKDGSSLINAALGHTDEAIRNLAHQVEDVDIVWKGEQLNILLSDHGVRELDFFISSHCLEHVVDIIDHLQGIQAALKTHGRVCFALPDLRYTFDFFRNPSTLADALRIHRSKSERHSSETLFDQVLNSVHINNMGCWSPAETFHRAVFTEPIETAWQYYLDDQQRDFYVDIHAWCFVPASFQLLMVDLARLNLIDLVVTKLASDKEGVTGSEFLVQLEKRPTPTNPIRNMSSDEFNQLRMQFQLSIVSQLSKRALMAGLFTNLL